MQHYFGTGYIIPFRYDPPETSGHVPIRPPVRVPRDRLSIGASTHKLWVSCHIEAVVYGYLRRSARANTAAALSLTVAPLCLT